MLEMTTFTIITRCMTTCADNINPRFLCIVKCKSMWPSEVRLHEMHVVYRAANQHSEASRPFALLVTRLRNRLEWGLVTTAPISAGTCLGFYSGEFRIDRTPSLYAASLLRNVDIHPFADEEHISEAQRRERPFANMNEPNAGEQATCCMLVSDFAAHEIDGVEHIPDYARALFFRGLACFTCRDLSADEALTWHYGKSYEEHRVAEDYTAGVTCTPDEVEAISHDAVFRTFPKVPWRVAYPVFTSIKSARFPKLRNKRRLDDEDTSSSGSGHVPKYTPRDEGRNVRNERRREARERQLEQQ